MKKPHWLEKENLYKIMFESEHPTGRIFDLTLMTAISLSIIISFVETIPWLAHTFKTVLEEFLWYHRLAIYPTPLSLLFLAQRKIYDSAAFDPFHPYLPHFQAVQLHQRGLYTDALVAKESHQDFRLLLVCADTRYLLGYADVYGRKWRA